MTKKTSLRLSLPAASLGIAAAFAPLFILTLGGRAPPMFGFEPYFVYGCALYFALSGASWISWATVAVACLGIVSHFLGQSAHHPVLGYERALGTQFTLLVALLGLMTALAWVRIRRFRWVDKTLGDFHLSALPLARRRHDIRSLGNHGVLLPRPNRRAGPDFHCDIRGACLGRSEHQLAAGCRSGQSNPTIKWMRVSAVGQRHRDRIGARPLHWTKWRDRRGV